jgi:hypothetical protein
VELLAKRGVLMPRLQDPVFSFWIQLEEVLLFSCLLALSTIFFVAASLVLVHSAGFTYSVANSGTLAHVVVQNSFSIAASFGYLCHVCLLKTLVYDYLSVTVTWIGLCHQ